MNSRRLKLATRKCWGASDHKNALLTALAHVAGDQTERAYRRGDALEKHRALADGGVGGLLRAEGRQRRFNCAAATLRAYRGAAAEPEHGTGQPDACDPEAFLAPLFGRCVHISQNVAGD
jgi:hypothetical protein